MRSVLQIRENCRRLGYLAYMTGVERWDSPYDRERAKPVILPPVADDFHQAWLDGWDMAESEFVV